MSKLTNDNWTDEECRFFFQLYLEEKKKGNKTRNGLNTTAKEFIVKTFEEKYGEKHIWDRFKNKYDTCRRIYVSVKKLIHNRTGMGYDDMGRINMSDDWWQERIKEWPGARKYKNKHVPNIDLFEEKFGAITVTGAEGWSAQQEESSLDSRVSGNNDEEDDCTDMPPPVGDTQNKNGGSRSKRKRKEVDPSTENAARCNVILDEKNQLMGKMILLMERENLRSGERGVEILNDLPGVKKWSKFHLAAVDHLLADPANRQGFIAFSSAEDKITILENRMGIKLDD